MRVIGHRWSPHVHELKDFLARSRIPYRWMDIERESQALDRAEQVPGVRRFPLCVFPDGTCRVEPDIRALAGQAAQSACIENYLGFPEGIPGGDLAVRAAVQAERFGVELLVVERDEQGFILAGPDLLHSGRRRRWKAKRDPYLLETSVPGIFVAGDARHGSVKRLATAVGEGAMAIQFIHEYCSRC